MSDMRKLIETFHEQLQESSTALQAIDASNHEKAASNFTPSGVLIIGMGGSGISGAIAADLLLETSKIPIIAIADYSIPGWVDNKTLVVACSYSGNTEETIEAVKAASSKGALITCVTSGGELGELATTNNWPIVIMPGGFPPRSQFGRSFMGLAWTLKNFKVFPSEMYNDLENTAKYSEDASLEIYKQAEALADIVDGKQIMLYSSTCLSSMVTRWRQQLNENSKLLVNSQVFPEMNHNELVGWDSGNDSYAAIILRSPEDHKRSQIRMDVCAEMIQEFHADVVFVDPDGANQMERLIHLLQIGDWLSLLLAEKSGTDAVDIHNIIRLKDELASHS